MRRPLRRHPDTPCPAVSRIEVGAERAVDGRLVLRFVVAGETGALRIPAATAPARADALWRHTCFEAFVRKPAEASYYEFNLAPSRQWAAYRFDDYRQGMRLASGFGAPSIEVQAEPGCFTLLATLEMATLPGVPRDEPWQLGLSAVIEEMSGRTSYWALAHPPGRPDFHHGDCFAIALAAA